MKGQFSILLIIALILIAVVFLFMSQSKDTTNNIVIANATYVTNNSINTTYVSTNQTLYINMTYNYTTVINNTYTGSITIPADNVSSGTFGGSYLFDGGDVSLTGNTNSICGQYETYNTPYCIDLAFYDQNSKMQLGLELTKVDIFDNLNNEMIIFYRTQPSYAEFLKPLTVTALATLNNVTINGYNTCETHIGIQVNYSRCFNSTGQIIERLGVFSV